MASKAPRRCCCNGYGVPITLMVLAVLLGAAAVLVPVLIESMMRDGIKNALVIDSTDSPGYAAWQDGRNPQAGQVYYNMYTYNVTNAEGVLRGEVPVLEEVGPFVYQRIKVRENVTWNEDATEVCFDPWSFYVPVDPDSEVGRAAGAVSHDLNITTVNMAFQALVETVGQKASWVLPVLYDKHSDLETMFVTRSSTDIFFGYEDPVLDLLHKLLPWAHITDGRFPGLQANETSPDAAASAGRSCELTGKVNVEDMRVLTRWNNMTSLMCCSDGPCSEKNGYVGPPAWNSSTANSIRGTPGTQYHPGVQQYDRLEVFVSSIFRWANVDCNETEVYRGVELLKCTIPPELMLNAKHNPENYQWYANGPDGLLNVTSCARHMKVFTSKPHFLDADPRLLDDVAMSPPNRTAHDTFIAVEPNTGTVMRAAERLQVNIGFGPVYADGRTFGSNIRNGSAALVGTSNGTKPYSPVKFFLPMAWFQEGGDATQSEVDRFNDSVLFGLHLQSYARIGGAALGGVCLLVGLVLLSRRLKENRRSMKPRTPARHVRSASGRMSGFGEDVPAEPLLRPDIA